MKITLLTLALVCTGLFVNAQQTVKAPAGKIVTHSLVKKEVKTTQSTAPVAKSKIVSSKKEGMLLAEPKKTKAITTKNPK